MTEQERKNMIKDIIQMLKEMEDIETEKKNDDNVSIISEFSSSVKT